MWTFVQSTGELFDARSHCQDIGYSGHADGKNNPAMQDKPLTGPIPQGTYVIGAPHDTPTHGPYVLPLTPFPGNQMFGRNGFLIHGDSLKSPGMASMGCIIVARSAREAIWNSGDHTLEVVDAIHPVTDLTGDISV